MAGRAELVAYCGLYCGDCLGYTGVVADAAEAFAEMLERHQFERTAAHIFPEELPDYVRFREKLAFMTELRCSGRCRKGEGEAVATGCAVRICCIDRGHFACHECGEFETCAKLRELHGELHYEASLLNMRAMREKGLEAWLAEGPRYCYWQETCKSKRGKKLRRQCRIREETHETLQDHCAEDHVQPGAGGGVSPPRHSSRVVPASQ